MSFNLTVSFFLALFFCLKGFATETKLIDLSKVKRVSYLLAASRGMGKSSFGHSYLRFSYREKLSSLDPVIEFVADVAADKINILKGIGIGGKYDAMIAITNYKNVQAQSNLRDDRDLTTYPLNISQEQMEEIASQINTLLQDGTDKKYTFFKTNCANLLSSVFKTSFDKDIKGISTVIPVALPRILRKHNLLTGEEFIDYGVTQQRKDIFDEKFPKDLIAQYPLFLQNIQAQITSKSTTDRILALTKLHLLRVSLEDQVKRDLNLFGLKVVMLESHGIRNYILPYFTRKDQSLARVNIDLIPVSSKSTEVIDINFKNKNDTLYISAKLETSRSLGPRKSRTSTTSYSNTIADNFTYTDGKVLHDGEVITRQFSDNITENEFFDESLFFAGEIVNYDGRKYIFPIMAREIETIKYDKQLESKDILSVRNGYKLDGVSTPMCYATIEMQQLLLNRVIWAPELDALSDENGIKALEALFAGKIVVIPGFEDISSFTKSLNQDDVARVIKNRQDSEYNFTARAKEWFSFSDKKLKAQDVYILKNMLAKGITPKVYFNVVGKRKGAARVAHGILITSVEEDDQNYYFEAYDPNFGLLKVRTDEQLERMKDKLADAGHSTQISKSYFSIRKSDSELVTSAYGNSTLILPEYSIEEQNAFNLVVKSSTLSQRAISSYKYSKNFIYSVSDFF